jgi:hypothetical protein
MSGLALEELRAGDQALDDAAARATAPHPCTWPRHILGAVAAPATILCRPEHDPGANLMVCAECFEDLSTGMFAWTELLILAAWKNERWVVQST